MMAWAGFSGGNRRRRNASFISLEKDHGLLDWSYQSAGATGLDHERAMIVAVAEIGAALREVALAVRQFNEASADSAHTIAEATQGPIVASPKK